MRSDDELLVAARRDPMAFREFYERYSLAVGLWLQKRTGHVELAGDLAAETFAQAWQHRRRFKPAGPESGVGWVFGIARNLLATYYRKQKVESKHRKRLGLFWGDRSFAEYEQAEERLTAESLSSDLEAATAALPADQWEALELRVVSQLPYDEVARLLECSVNAARVRVSRALQSLRISLESELT